MRDEPQAHEGLVQSLHPQLPELWPQTLIRRRRESTETEDSMCPPIPSPHREHEWPESRPALCVPCQRHHRKANSTLEPYIQGMREESTGPWCQPLNHSGCLQLGDLLHWKLRMVHPEQDFGGGANSARAQINCGATGAQSGCRGWWPRHRRRRPRPHWPAQSWGPPSFSWQNAAGGLDGYPVAWRSCTACRPVDRRKWAGGMTDSRGTSFKVPSPRQPATGTGLQGKLGPLLLT